MTIFPTHTRNLRPFICGILFLFFFIFNLLPAFAQDYNPRLSFSKTTYHLGKVQFQDTLRHRFHFRNKSEETVKITDIKTDCACVLGSDVGKEIAAGDSASVEVVFFPYKYGEFQKVIIIQTDNAGNYTLTLKGDLRPHLTPEQEYKHTLGVFRSKTKYLHLGRIASDMHISKKFCLYNPTDKDFTFSSKMNLPAHIQVRFDSSYIIKAKEKGIIYIMYDADKKQDFGHLEDEITLKGKHKGKERNIKLKVTASISEKFPEELTEEVLESYPHLIIEKEYVNLGRKYIKNIHPDSLFTTFILQNKSNMPLKIHKITEGNGLELHTPQKEWKEVAPHSNVMLTVRLEVPKKRGTYTRKLTLMCNDPRKPIRTLSVKTYFR